MSEAGSILAFYPHNFYEMSAGTHMRVSSLLLYLKERGYRVDLLSIDGYSNRWGAGDLERRDRADSIRVCGWRPSIREVASWAGAWRSGGLPDLSIRPLRAAFKEMASSRRYSHVLITYAYWASLAEAAGEGAVKVLNLQDFLTLNYFMAKKRRRFALGRMFEQEVEAISRFDCAISISEEETIALKPFCPATRFVDVPVSFPGRFSDRGAFEYDLVFVGSDNPFNREGMGWFIKGVLPLLPGGVRTAVVGGVCRRLAPLPGMTLVPHAEDLGEVYRRSRLSICPLLGGTGLKVKVIEALSYGMPVVTTSWGLTGMMQKYDNGCLAADDAASFASNVALLLGNGAEYERQSGLARAFFTRRYSMDVFRAALDCVFPGAGPR
jgi:glycosyltransferase involved in cell wall biosynthesis